MFLSAFLFLNVALSIEWAFNIIVAEVKLNETCRNLKKSKITTSTR